MGMAADTRIWTVDEVLALPDDGTRYEVVDGELLVTPAPSLGHQDVVGQLYARLSAYLQSHPVGSVFLSPADIALAPDTLVQPDVFVVPPVGGRRPAAWSDIRQLLLAVEVLSPSTARADRTTKRRLYQREGVPEYWVVDVDARLIERWRPEDERPEILDERVVWQPAAATEPLAIELESVFRETGGD